MQTIFHQSQEFSRGALKRRGFAKQVLKFDFGVHIQVVLRIIVLRQTRLPYERTRYEIPRRLLPGRFDIVGDPFKAPPCLVKVQRIKECRGDLILAVFAQPHGASCTQLVGSLRAA